MGRTNTAQRQTLGNLTAEPEMLYRGGDRAFLLGRQRARGNGLRLKWGRFRLKIIIVWCGQALGRAAQGGGGVPSAGAAQEDLALVLWFSVKETVPVGPSDRTGLFQLLMTPSF